MVKHYGKGIGESWEKLGRLKKLTVDLTSRLNRGNDATEGS